MSGPPTTSLNALAKYFLQVHASGDAKTFFTELLGNAETWNNVDTSAKDYLGEHLKLRWVPLAVSELSQTIMVIRSAFGTEKFLEMHATATPDGLILNQSLWDSYSEPLKALIRCTSPEVVSEPRGQAQLADHVRALDKSAADQVRQLGKLMRQRAQAALLDVVLPPAEMASAARVAQLEQDFRTFHEFLGVSAEELAHPNRPASLANGAQAFQQLIAEASGFRDTLAGSETELQTVMARIRMHDETAATLIEHVQANVRDTRSEIESARARIDELLAQAERAGFLKGVEPHAKKYEDAARSFEIASRFWLGVATVIILVMMVWIWRSPTDLPPGVVGEEGTAWVAFVPSFGRLFALLSVSSFAAVWAARNYKANRHNQLVNEHRALALRTMDGLVQAAPNEDSRAHALRAATDTIFGHVPTGYVPAENEATSHPTIVEILRPGGG